MAEVGARGRPFSAGPIPAGHVHHFLLPAEGWGAVAGEKEAKELAPEDTKRLDDWRKGIRKPPSRQEVSRSQALPGPAPAGLAGRAEYLWSLVIERLRISEREISRTIDVWGAEDLPVAQEAKPRDEILADLTSPHPVLAPEDSHGRLVRPLVLAGRQGRPARRLRRHLRHESAPEPVIVNRLPSRHPCSRPPT